MPHSAQDLAALLALAAKRGGVVSPADLRECGFSPKAVRRRIVDGQWQRCGLAVIPAPRMGGRPRLSDLALSWILQITFGPASRISGALAMKQAGWTLPCQTHIVVVDNSTRASIPGVTVLRRPDAGSLTKGANDATTLRFVTAREALIDVLSVLPPAPAADLADAALQRRVLPPESLVREIHSRLGSGRRGARQLREVLDRVMSGSRSEAEHRMAALLRRAEAGSWIANHPLRDQDGRVVAELDFADITLRIAIEVDGRAHHSGRTAFERDRRRQNIIMLDGWLVLRFTWEQITEHPEEVIAAVREAVAGRLSGRL